MLSRVYAPAHIGMEGQLITVECDLSNGLPAFIVVGLPDKAIEEAKERVRSALKHSNLVAPIKRITLNLAPADLPKDGSAFDLPMAVSILHASGQVDFDPSGTLFAGELALDGSLRPVPGILSYALLARHNGIPELFVPAANASQAAIIPGIKVYPVTTLFALFQHLIGEKMILPQAPPELPSQAHKISVDFANIYGQEQAKRAVEIAVAGNHNLLLSGPPGSGKTLLSKALVQLMPPPSFEEIIEITQLQGLAGIHVTELITSRPFRHPHHTASSVALIGGGRFPRPGEISLSHHGVLFLDELPEFPRSVLETLRQPLEDGIVTIARATGSITYPAKFLLVATQNPCPCGYAGDPIKNCSCSPSQIFSYHRKISGPLLDRIDLIVDIGRVDQTKLIRHHSPESSAMVTQRIAKARNVQKKRYKSPSKTNADMSNSEIVRFCKLDETTQALIKQAALRLNLSARSYMRTLKVARTIADLDDSPTIKIGHVTEALQYRDR